MNQKNVLTKKTFFLPNYFSTKNIFHNASTMVVFEPRELDNLPSANWKVEEGTSPLGPF